MNPDSTVPAATEPPQRILFVSDVHLDPEAPESERQFLDFLRADAAGASTLYILGDLFESWVGDDSADYGPVLEALAGLTRQGVGCFLMHGNRDFLIGPQFSGLTGCRLLPDPVVIDLDGERVLLTHGDALCTDDHAYQELRTMVRDELWQKRFLGLPLATRRMLAGEVRAGSRAHISQTAPTIMDVNSQAVEQAFRSTRVRRIIHGHTHRPGVHQGLIDGEPAERMVLGAWYEQGSCLAYQGGRYDLRTLAR